MTTKEAIEELEYIKDSLVSCTLSYDALDMAIRSLEAWDEIDDLVNKTYWAFPIGLDYCLDRLTEIMKEVKDEQIH